MHANFALATSANPAKPGETVLIYCSGLGAVESPPGFVGLYQINAEVPAGLKSGNQPAVIEVSGSSSNSVLLPVE